MGFGASMVFGTVVGGFADKYGRKANCLLFAILYSIGCVTKHFNNYWILMFGRLMGGISTSILYSAFETWMIHEHKSLGFDHKWIDSTFANMTFGSGAVAIIAGLVASFLAASVNLVAPFDASMLLLIAGGFIIATRWRENYGTVDSSTRQTSAWESFEKARRLLMSSERVLLLGVIQSCFESAMYIFVFMCVPLEVRRNLCGLRTPAHPPSPRISALRAAPVGSQVDAPAGGVPSCGDAGDCARRIR
jgi:MFS family permease